MGKSTANSWLTAVKRAFRSPTNDDEKRVTSKPRSESEQEQEQDQDKKRGKKRWMFRRHFSLETTIQNNAGKCADSKAVRVCSGEENPVRKQPKTEHAVATAAVEIPLIALLRQKDKPAAALLIQKIFRGYLARKALLALRGVVKLQALIRGHNVRKRAKTTLQCIQSLVRVQALVCDQRRRLSCESMSLASIFTHENPQRKSMSRNTSRVSSSLDADPTGLEEIHALIQKAKECSLIQGQTLAHALSQQILARDEDQSSDKTVHSWIRKDRNFCNQREYYSNSIKTVHVDEASRRYSFTPPTRSRDHEQNTDPFHHVLSPRTPSSSRTKSIPCSPCYREAAETPNARAHYTHRMSMGENSCPLPRPNYMAATASAMARVRPCSTPRQRTSSPSRELAGSARKRLSFHTHDGQEQDDKAANFQRCHGSDMLCYATD